MVLGEGAPQRAKGLGVTQQQLHKLEKTTVLPGTKTLALVCFKTGASGHWLLTGDGERWSAESVGAQQIFDQGVQDGLRRAQEALRPLGTTSGVSDTRQGILRAAEEGAPGREVPPPPQDRGLGGDR